MSAQRPGGKTWSNLMVGDWADDAACAGQDSELWFPAEISKRGRYRRGQDAEAEAKRICQSCVVIAQCLQHALDHDEADGVWGGLSPQERRDLLAAPPLRPMSEMDHGTEAGAKQHERRREVPCPACRAAAARAQRIRKQRRKATQ